MKPNNSKTNKISNRNTVLKILALNSPVSRIELSRITGLSKMSLTNIISEFNELGFIKEKGLDVEATGKRKPVLLELTEKCICAIGINITRNYTEGCLTDITGKILYNKRVEYSDLNKDMLLDIVISLVGKIVNLGENNIVGIGISCIGPLDIENGIILSPTKFYGIENLNITEPVTDAFKLPAFLYKNTNCAVLAEKYYGLGKDKENFIYISVTKGVGCAAVVNGHQLLGKSGHACEIGHMSVNPDGEACACGNRGCLELYSNTVNTVNKFNQAVRDGAKTSVSGKINFDKIVEGASNGDHLSSAILDDMCKYMAVGIVSAINTFDPETVIIGGDVATGGTELIKRLTNFVGNKPFPMKRHDVDIVISEFFDKAPLIGAAAIVFENMYFSN